MAGSSSTLPSMITSVPAYGIRTQFKIILKNKNRTVSR
jgi:hypothetical protein